MDYLSFKLRFCIQNRFQPPGKFAGKRILPICVGDVTPPFRECHSAEMGESAPFR